MLLRFPPSVGVELNEYDIPNSSSASWIWYARKHHRGKCDSEELNAVSSEQIHTSHWSDCNTQFTRMPHSHEQSSTLLHDYPEYATLARLCKCATAWACERSMDIVQPKGFTRESMHVLPPRGSVRSLLASHLLSHQLSAYTHAHAKSSKSHAVECGRHTYTAVPTTHRRL